MCPCCFLHFEQSFYRRLLNSRDPLQWRCLNKDLVDGTLVSSYVQEQTERERRVWPRISVICVILQACMISADDFLQTCNITLMLLGHV